MEQFIFQQSNHGTVLTKSNSTNSFVTVPDTWRGEPVCQIGNYAFAQQLSLKRITLPKTIHTIGNHAFYNCSNLEHVILQNGVRSTGDGVFKNCRKLKYISVQGFAYLKSIVNDFTNEFTLSVTALDGQKIMLMFPEYDYIYEEVVPPREFRAVNYGSGSFYRSCVTRQGINFNEYDSIFPRAAREDDPKTVQSIAFYRLLYPYQLREQYQKMYLSYLTEYITEVIESVLSAHDVPRLELMIKYHILTEEIVESAAAQAGKLDFAEGVSLLMDYRLTEFGRKRHSFIL